MTKKRSKLLALAVLMILTLAVLVSCAAGQQAKETGSAVGETGAANHGETAKTGETPAPTITITAPAANINVPHIARSLLGV